MKLYASTIRPAARRGAGSWTLAVGLTCLAASIIASEVDDGVYAQALEQYKQGEYEQSLAVIRKVFNAHTDSYRLRFLAASNHWRLGNFGSSEAHFAAAVRLKPDEKGAYLDYARMLLDAKKFSQAATVARKGRQSAGDNPKFDVLLGRANLGMQSYAKALEHAYQAKMASPDDWEPIFLEGVCNLAQGKADKAEFLLGWSLSKKPDSPEIRYHLALAAQRVGDQARAKGDKKKAARQFAAALKHAKSIPSERAFPSAAALAALVETLAAKAESED